MLKMIGLVLLFLLTTGLTLYLIPLPAPVLARLVSDQQAYFFQDEEVWLKEHSFPEAAWVKLLEFKLRHDLKEHSEEQLGLSARQPAGSIEAAAREIRLQFINQTQQDVPIISNSALASFVRGYGYCDHVNGYLALLLNDYLDKVQLYGVQDEKGVSPHTLLRTESSLGVVWVDGFTCVSAFGFRDELSAQGQNEIPVFEQKAACLLPAAYYKRGYSFNEYSLAYTAEKAYNRLNKLFIKKTVAPETVVVSATTGHSLSQNPVHHQQILDRQQAESYENKSLYLEARVLHLFGEHQKAALLYQQLIKNNPEGSLAAYAATFLKRLNGENLPCQ